MRSKKNDGGFALVESQTEARGGYNFCLMSKTFIGVFSSGFGFLIERVEHSQ